ncbi:NAD-dependent epimerase/dehydratase family protein [Gammaproteobacteria bacterium]|nr:NAD-dependent epimerase/dehydratase family protein [Gammaproteobacteria bacterium]
MDNLSSIVKTDLEHIKAKISSQQSKLEGSTILVTGCAGFLGFYMINFFTYFASELGINKIIGLDNFILDQPNWLAKLEKDYPEILKIQNFDISSQKIHNVEDSDTVTHVIHAASIASPSFYRQFPLVTVDSNIWGLRGLLDFYRESKTLEGFLFFSSSEIYGDPEPDRIPTNESYRGRVSCHGPRACYDESKRFGETLSWIYAHEYKMPITVARPFNNYGPGMRLGDKRLPADFAQSVFENKNIKILSDGSPTRTFCYVADAVSGYLLCLLHGKYDQFNIGTEKPEISVKDIAQLYVESARKVFNYNLMVDFQKSNDQAYLIDNPNRRCPDITKAKSILNYKPTISIEDGILRYLNFIKEENIKT